jgi:uncharacterized protein YigE (DUF2233 family)
MTTQQRIEKTVFERSVYKTLKDAQSGIRAHGTDDYIAVAGVLYSMEEYDGDGKQITYYNKRTDTKIYVDTANRYSETGFKDAVLTLQEDAGFYRNDINYID